MVKRSRCGSYKLVRPPVAIVADDTLHVLNRKVEGTVRRLLVNNDVGAIFQYGCHSDTEREDRDDLLGLEGTLIYIFAGGCASSDRTRGGPGPILRPLRRDSNWTFRHVRLAGCEQKVFI